MTGEGGGERKEGRRTVIDSSDPQSWTWRETGDEEGKGRGEDILKQGRREALSKGGGTLREGGALSPQLLTWCLGVSFC